MQIHLFDLQRLDIQTCADLAAGMVEHCRKKGELLPNGLPNAKRIARLMECTQIRTTGVRVDARRRENVAKRGANLMRRARRVRIAMRHMSA